MQHLDFHQSKTSSVTILFELQNEMTVRLFGLTPQHSRITFHIGYY